jgi:hypothetical protein
MIGAHHTESRNRGRLLIALRWLAAAAVIGVLLRFLPLHLLAEAVRRVPVATFVAIVLGYLCAHAVGIAKWRMVVNAAGAQLDFRTSAECYTGGLFGTLFLPSIIGGDVVRLAVGLRRSANGKRRGSIHRCRGAGRACPPWNFAIARRAACVNPRTGAESAAVLRRGFPRSSHLRLASVSPSAERALYPFPAAGGAGSPRAA